MKRFIVVSSILAAFFWIGTATSKGYDFICDYNIGNYLAKDTISHSYYQGNSNDTIIIRSYKDTLWDQKTADICKILVDSCKVTGYKILIVDTTTNVALHDTRYGRKVFFRQCP